MNENYIRKKIKTKIEDFNTKQESLRFNMYLLKAAMLLVLVVFFFLVSPVIAALFTPLFMNNSPTSDAIAISYSAIGVSLVVVGSLIYFFFKYKKQPSRKNDSDEVNFEYTKPPKSKIKNFLQFIPFLTDLFTIIISIFTKPIPPLKQIYMDSNSYNIAIELIKHLSNSNNHSESIEYLDKYSPEYSSRWISNLIDKLELLEIIKVFHNDTDNKFILLNLDFYDPTDH